jgi:hypothetical protein
VYDAKANRAYYLSRGLCPRCGGKRPVEPGRCKCTECRERDTGLVKQRRDAWTAAGLCSRCGRPIEREGYKTCNVCRSKSKVYEQTNAKNVKALHDRRLDAGKCVRCGTRWAEGGHTMCRLCMDKQKQRHKRYDPDGSKAKARREKRIAEGLCVDCGRPTEGFKRCRRCLDMRKDSWRKYAIHQRTLKGQNNGNAL